MNRRNFLKSMLGLIAVAALNPAKAVAGMGANAPRPQTVILASEYLTIDDFSERFLRPAIEALANKIDQEMMEIYLNERPGISEY